MNFFYCYLCFRFPLRLVLYFSKFDSDHAVSVIHMDDKNNNNNNSNIDCTSTCADYNTEWDVNTYLRTHFSSDYANSVIGKFFPVNVIKILEQHTQRLQGKQRVLEFGGGPCLWPSFLLAEYFDEIWFCDYLTSNLQCVRDWLNMEPNAYDWKAYFDWLLDIKEGHHDNERSYEDRLRFALNKGNIFQCDIHADNILFLDSCTSEPQFDMIFSSGCLEAACSTVDIFKQSIDRLGRLLKPGGMFLLLTYRNSSFYSFNDYKFTDLPINEELLRKAYEESGLFTDPIFITTDIPIHGTVGDADGLMISYAHRKTI